jgi:hypothetical protein
MKILIQIGIFLAIFLISLFTTAQSRSSKVHDLFAGKEGVSSISLSKSAITPFEIFLDEETKKIIYKMERFRLLSYDEGKGQLRKHDVFQRITDELTTAEYFTIDPGELNCKNCRGNWNGDTVKLFGRGTRSAMNELHILVIDNNNCMLFSFHGDITVEDINNCANFSNTAKVNISF